VETPLLAVCLGAAAAWAMPQRTSAQIRVLAAASLTNVFPQIDKSPTYSFAGSDALAAQIRLGAPADVFASANTSLPNALYAQGLVEKPVVFTTNKLVLVVPKSNPAGIETVFDLRRKGIKLVVGTPTVPIGSYTRTILKNLALTSALENAVSPVVKTTRDRAAAVAFINAVLSKEGQARLAAAGFGAVKNGVTTYTAG
jgi:molybdate transport system substrate-binding protein